MADLADGESVEVQGSGAKPYVLKNVGGVYSCSCPAWRNQSVAIERRTCKHLRKLRGEAAEQERIGGTLPQRPAPATNGASESATEPPLLLAEAWDNALDLSGWWMSEKLDGVRAYWDGRQFLSRQGNLYHAPDWFVAGLPTTPLDGELWIDRKAFQRTVSIVRRQDKSEHWKSVRYVIFDAPQAATTFEERVAYLHDQSRDWRNEFARIHEQAVCRDVAHLRAELDRVESLGGEGLMLRQPGSAYVSGRSSTLLKVKRFLDAEAEVIGHEPGKGRHQGRLGALLVRLPSGKVFSVGTGFSDKERAAPPAIGSVITFRYQEFSDAGIPRFPSYVGERRDAAAPVARGEPVNRADPSPATSRRTSAPLEIRSPPAIQSPAVGDWPPPCSASRRWECVEGNSSKFWEVSVSGADLTTRWGKIGSGGQSKTKTFASVLAAEAERDRLIAEKVAKGYRELP